MPDATQRNFVRKSISSPLLRHGFALAAFGLSLFVPFAIAQASELTIYECEPEGDIFYEVAVSWVDGNSTASIGPRGEYYSAAQIAAETEKMWSQPVASGFSFQSSSYEFFGKGADARLAFKKFPKEAPIPCVEVPEFQTHASGAVGGAEVRHGGQPARSLGGNLRNGPGTNFSVAGSLAEGASVSVLANTGVRFDGYDWFEVRVRGGVAYQWGGIMCSDGAAIAGMYGDCASALRGQNVGNAQTISGGGGWMAFAIGSGGRFGHGAGADRREAESYAMQYCGDGSCRIEDVTQAQCHAYAQGTSGHWFGAGPSKRDAERYALGFCSNGGSSCAISYSYCR